MELTAPKKSALFFAQHKLSKGRAALFRRLRDAGENQAPDIRRQTCAETHLLPQLHRDNGR
jgi:hypothetical protein